MYLVNSNKTLLKVPVLHVTIPERSYKKLSFALDMLLEGINKSPAQRKKFLAIEGLSQCKTKEAAESILKELVEKEKNSSKKEGQPEPQAEENVEESEPQAEENVEESEPQAEENVEDFDAMTKPQLTEYAKELGISIKKKDSKTKIIEKIRKHVKED